VIDLTFTLSKEELITFRDMIDYGINIADELEKLKKLEKDLPEDVKALIQVPHPLTNSFNVNGKETKIAIIPMV